MGLHQVLVTLLALFYTASTYNPTVNVYLQDSKYCLHGLLQGLDQIVFTIQVNWTQAEEKDWKKELFVSTGGVTFCKIAINEDSCSGVYRKNDRCYCALDSGRESRLAVNFTAEAGHEGNKFEFVVTRVDDQASVKEFKVVPEVYATPILEVSINNKSIMFESDCRHTFNTDLPHKIHVCTRNLNNPQVQSQILNSDHEPTKFTTRCANYHLDLSNGVNLFEISYIDECNRTGEVRCSFEGYANESTTKTNICKDCDIQPEAQDWYEVFKWLLPVVIVVAAVSTLIIIVIKVRQEKERQILLRSMSSHRTLAASRSQLTTGRSKSNINFVGSKSNLSVKGSSSKLNAKGSSSKLNAKGSSPKLNTKGSRVQFIQVEDERSGNSKTHSNQSSKTAFSASAKGSSVDSGINPRTAKTDLCITMSEGNLRWRLGNSVVSAMSSSDGETTSYTFEANGKEKAHMAYAQENNQERRTTRNAKQPGTQHMGMFYTMNRDFSSVLCFKKDDAKRYPATNSSQTVPGFVCPKEIFKNRLINFYSIKAQNETHVRFECLLNFHIKSGSYWSTCVNGTWSGEEPVCEVDYYKDRIRLSLIIIVVCLFVSLIFLGSDFCMFMKKRLEVRQENARVRAFQISRMIKYDNMRCTAYPNHGLNDIKLYIPELQQFIGIKPKEYKTRESRMSDMAYDEEFFQSHAATKAQIDDKRQDKFTRGLFLFRMRSRKSTYPA